MKIINGETYFTAKEIGMMVNRTHLTVHLWDSWSNELEERGDVRLIPQPIKLGKQKTRYWKESDVRKIEFFAKNIKRGDLAEFSKRQWSKKEVAERKKQKVSEKQAIKSINSKEGLSLEDKLIYALIYFKENIQLCDICSKLSFDKEIVDKSIQKLVDNNYIYLKDTNYYVFN